MAGFHKGLMGSVCALGMLLGAQSNAQVASYYNNNVMVDLSVLNDNGLGRGALSDTSRRDLGKLPPVSMPKSTFYGLPDDAPKGTANAVSTPPMQPTGNATQSRIVLKKPTLNAPSQMASASKSTAPKPVARKTVTPKTTPKPMVKKTKAPKVTEAPKVAEVTETPAPTKAPEPPKPAAAPTKPVEVAKAAPAPEAPKAKAEVKPTPAPEPAPKKIVEKAAEAPKVEATPAPAAPKVMADAPPPPPPSAVEPKKVDSAMAEAAKKQTEVAALPPSGASSVRVAFQSEQSKMPSMAESELKEIAEVLKKQPDDRVQLLAYAGGENLSASKARRLSLSRALAVRSYLISQGIGSTRIDVRALGNKTTEEPLDRVDVQIAPR